MSVYRSRFINRNTETGNGAYAVNGEAIIHVPHYLHRPYAHNYEQQNPRTADGLRDPWLTHIHAGTLSAHPEM